MIQKHRFLRIRNLALVTAVLTGFTALAWWLPAQDATPPGFRAFPLQYVQAADISGKLESLLSETSGTHDVLVDRQANRILVRGSDETLRLAAQLMTTLDRPAAAPAAALGAGSGAAAAVVRGYAVGLADLEDTVARLRTQFPPASGVRIAPDQRTGQVIIVAPDEIQRRIAQTLSTSAASTAAQPATAASTPRDSEHNLRHVTWRDLEDDLRRIWGQRLAVVAQRNGEVASVSVTGAMGSRTVLQVDRRRDRVLFSGAPAEVQIWRRIVQAIDQPRNSGGPRTELVPVNRADPDKVHRAVALLQAAGQSDGTPLVTAFERRAGNSPNDVVAMVFQPKADAPPATPPAPPTSATPPPAAKPGEQTPAGAQRGAAAGEAAADQEGGLIGPVQIEFMEGLDVIVLRGQRRDVERVRKLIEDIERLSVETQPTIEVVQLRYVGCQALADLMQQIYLEILSTRQGQVTIRALVKPNAVLLIGRPESVDIIKQLIARLDQPVEPETQFEVFQLKHVSAGDAEQTVRNFFVDRLGQTTTGVGVGAGITGLGAQAGQQRPGLGARVNIVSDFRTNSLIVQASPRDLAEVRRLITQIDVEASASANELKIFRLKNALASDVAPVLQDALNWQLIGNRTPVGATPSGAFGAGGAFGAFGLGAQQQQERARLRSAMLTFMTVDSQGGKILESGLLSDVRVTADINGNALIVTGPSKSMGLIEALIKELDHLPNAQAQIKVFTIVNGDATSLSNMLRQLLGQTAQQTGTQAFNQLFGQGALNPFLQPGLQSAAAMGESSLVPIRFGVDARTNSIIASGSEGDLGVVEAVLLRLDEDSFHKHKTTVYWLANAPAQSVATAVQQWLQNRITAYTQQMQLSPENPEVRYAQQVIVVPETISNTVIVSAVPSLFEEVKRVIEALDRRPPMIKIDVLIAEVTLTDNFEFGAEYGLQNSLLYDRTVTNAAGNKVGFNFNNKPLGDVGDSNKGVVAGQGLSSFGLGRTSPTLGYGGLVLSASSDAVSVLLRALQDKGRIQILSRPQITTLDSQAASVNIGQIVSRTRGSTTTQGVVTQNVEDVPTGILLGVTPRVTPDGLVVMELDAEKSQLSDTTSNIPNPGIGGGTVAIQNIDSTQASTTVSARSGQTVVFAGLIQSNKTSRRKGIPWLSDIPLVGPLFRVTTESDTRRELLIVMTPHVVRGDEDVDWIRQTESERMSWCLADVVDVYGDKSFGARPGCWCGADRGHCRCLRRARVVYPDQNPSGLETIPSPATVDSVPTPIEDQPVLAPPEQTSRRTFTEEASPQAAWAAPAGPALPYGPPRAPFVGPDRSYPGTPALYTGPSPSAFAAPAAYQGPVPPASVGGPRRLPVGDGNVASGGG